MWTYICKICGNREEVPDNVSIVIAGRYHIMEHCEKSEATRRQMGVAEKTRDVWNQWKISHPQIIGSVEPFFSQRE